MTELTECSCSTKQQSCRQPEHCIEMLVHTVKYILNRETNNRNFTVTKTANKTSNSSRVFNICSTIRVRSVFSFIEIEQFLRHVRDIDWFYPFICEICLRCTEYLKGTMIIRSWRVKMANTLQFGLSCLFYKSFTVL